MKNLKYLLLTGTILGSTNSALATMEELERNVTEIKTIVSTILSNQEKSLGAADAAQAQLRARRAAEAAAEAAAAETPKGIHEKIRSAIMTTSRDVTKKPDLMKEISEAHAKGFDFNFMPGGQARDRLLYKANAMGLDDEIKAQLAAAGATLG